MSACSEWLSMPRRACGRSPRTNAVTCWPAPRECLRSFMPDNVQIFGVKNSNDTRAAERFFKERRLPIQMVDLHQRPMAPAEIRRFSERFGLTALVDTESKAYEEGGLKYLRMTDADLLARIEREPKLLRLPLVRRGPQLAVGRDEAGWKAMAGR